MYSTIPNSGLPGMTLAGIPGKPSTQTGFGSACAYTQLLRQPACLGVGLGRGQQSTHDRVSSTRGVLTVSRRFWSVIGYTEVSWMPADHD